MILCSVDGCDDPSYRDLGDAIFSNGIFGCDVASSICFNSRDANLEDVRQVIDALLSKNHAGMQS